VAVVVTEVSFLRGLRIAIAALTAITMLALALPNLLARLNYPPGPAVQAAYFALLLAITAVDVVLVVRDRSWGVARWPVLGLVLATYLAYTLALPASAQFTVDNWYFNIVGWYGVLLLFDQPLPAFLAYLLAYFGATAVPIVFGHGGRQDVVGLAITAVSVGGFQVLTASAAHALRRVAASAALAAAEEERSRTRRAVARRVHSDRRRRYRDLTASAGPLLAGLADGSLDPADAEVVRRCALEAARMRRLFAESDDTSDKLLHELRACVDIAERRGVPVEVISHGSWPELPREVRRALTDGPMRVLSTLGATASPARVAIVGAFDTVSVSVVGDGELTGPAEEETHGVRTTSISDGGRVWVEATWRAAT
jgi:hypothetical protein